MIYLDNAATTKISPEVLKAVTPWLTEDYGNPSSAHALGRKAAIALKDARRRCAEVIGGGANEVFFTSGGTESDNIALRGAARLMSERGKRHIIVSAFEHEAVLGTAKDLEKSGFSVTYLPVYDNGIVRIGDLKNALREDTALVSVMYVNNEAGTVQPVAEIGALCRERGVLFHTDAVQAAGNLPINVKEQNIDLLSLSGHKLHAMKGTGLLYVRDIGNIGDIALPPMMTGGGQERGLRSGTENVAGAVGLAEALTQAAVRLPEKQRRLTALRDRLIRETLKIDGARLIGDREKRVPNIALFTFDGVEGEALVLQLDIRGIAASSGSACASGKTGPSHVLTAMGVPERQAAGSLRISMSDYTTEEEIDELLTVLPEVVGKLRLLTK